MCSDAYYNGIAANAAMLRSWAFGDVRPVVDTRCTTVRDTAGRYPTRAYSVPVSLGVFAGQAAAIAQYIADVGHTVRRCELSTRFVAT